jgi:hypothetical protein
MTNKIELEPCPFCGVIAPFVERADSSSCYVVCNDCLARGPTTCNENEADVAAEDAGMEPGENAARRSWNTRALTLQPPSTDKAGAIMLEIAAADDAHQMWERRYWALKQMYATERCFADQDGRWGLRDFLSYSASVCGFAEDADQTRPALTPSPKAGVPSREDVARIVRREIFNAVAIGENELGRSDRLTLLNEACERTSDAILALIPSTIRNEALFEAIAHGDDEHRAWLKEAISKHFDGLPVPPPRGAGSKERLKNEALEEAARGLFAGGFIEAGLRGEPSEWKQELEVRTERLREALKSPSGERDGR